MSESNLNNSSKTNWERIDAITDEEIDVSDSPPLTDKFFAKAKWLMPGESAARQTVKDESEEGVAQKNAEHQRTSLPPGRT